MKEGQGEGKGDSDLMFQLESMVRLLTETVITRQLVAQGRVETGDKFS